ncbi:DUF3037 domain-containing protein [Sphingobacterium sp. SG20118]|uniref:DUF3037 domain-containing protein n=1 Tax=Sphingobacterium TaxID=28453 RepID=UPI0004F7237B|nr:MULTISPECIES: DUF3037 domain-containing protein [Sphingobacterium]AIM36004.1 hypothetical protein KO02_04365 [Sphingobacterium sp. ML3W]MDH5827866.1 DUF3037 domain-containing protein [Sphingobacterium faecium]
MPEKTLYEYAVVRLVPRVEREEFINVGVALYCRKNRFANVLFHIDETRAHLLCPDVDLEMIRKHLESFVKICVGDKDGGKLATLDLTERFRWLTANRSTVIQCSPVHPGLCNDPAVTLQLLFEKLVL